MNGHVFQCFNECNDKTQFSKTVEAVGEYIAKKLKYPGNMDSLTKDLVLPTIPESEELDPEETNLLVKAIWNKKVTSYCTRTNYLESNLKTAYAVILGQCSKAMKAKLTSLDDFKTKSHNIDCIWILKEIKGITYGFEGQRSIYLSLDDARTSYYAYTQGPNDTIAIYLEHFTSLVEVLEHYGGTIGKLFDPPMLHQMRRSAKRLRVTAPLRWRSSNERTIVVSATSGTTSRTSLPEVMTSIPLTSQQTKVCWSISSHQSGGSGASQYSSA
jgi:hypothetical protein